MQCLYCGKKIGGAWLWTRNVTFCSDEHARLHQEALISTLREAKERTVTEPQQAVTTESQVASKSVEDPVYPVAGFEKQRSADPSDRALPPCAAIVYASYYPDSFELHPPGLSFRCERLNPPGPAAFVDREACLPVEFYAVPPAAAEESDDDNWTFATPASDDEDEVFEWAAPVIETGWTESPKPSAPAPIWLMPTPRITDVRVTARKYLRRTYSDASPSRKSTLCVAGLCNTGGIDNNGLAYGIAFRRIAAEHAGSQRLKAVLPEFERASCPDLLLPLARSAADCTPAFAQSGEPIEAVPSVPIVSVPRPVIGELSLSRQLGLLPSTCIAPGSEALLLGSILSTPLSDASPVDFAASTVKLRALEASSDSTRHLAMDVATLVCSDGDTCRPRASEQLAVMGVVRLIGFDVPLRHPSSRPLGTSPSELVAQAHIAVVDYVPDQQDRFVPIRAIATNHAAVDVKVIIPATESRPHVRTYRPSGPTYVFSDACDSRASAVPEVQFPVALSSEALTAAATQRPGLTAAARSCKLMVLPPRIVDPSSAPNAGANRPARYTDLSTCPPARQHIDVLDRACLPALDPVLCNTRRSGRTLVDIAHNAAVSA